MDDKKFNSAGRLHLLLETVPKLVRRNALDNLKRILQKAHPADVAALLRAIDEKDRRSVFQAIEDTAAAAEVLTELAPAEALALAEHLEPLRLQSLLQAMPDDDATDLFALLPEDVTQNLLDISKKKELENIEELMGYREDSAGGLMTPEFLAVEEDCSAGDAIKRVQRAVEAETVFYLYVVDQHGNLVGVLSLRQLLTAAAGRKIKEMMIKEVVRVTTETDQEEVARIVSRYNLLAIPVVDENNKMVGIITVDDVIDVLREEATEDIARMAGWQPEDVDSANPIRASIFARLPWLSISLLAGLLALVLFFQFAPRLNLSLAVMALVPLFLALAANVGNQSATVVLRGLVTKQLDRRQVLDVLFREIRISAAFGLVYGAVVFLLLVYLLSQTFALALVMAGALALTLVFSAICSTLLPILFNRLTIDPALAAGQLLTNVNYVLSLLIYFSALYFFLP